MISQAIEAQLDKLNITPLEFSELIIRILDYGVITRDESQVETQLYDRFLQCSELVEDYLSVMKVILQHDRKFCFIRAFPPGAIIPGVQSEDDPPFQSGFRTKPSQNEVAVILILRVEYEKSLREGKVDEKGRVMISLEGISIAMKNLLKRTLPENQGDRMSIFRHLRQLRLIKFNSESDLESEDSWISIQPSITSFVSDQVLNELYPQQEQEAENAHVL